MLQYMIFHLSFRTCDNADLIIFDNKALLLQSIHCTWTVSRPMGPSKPIPPDEGN